jgi:hypothetical protein
LLPLTTAPSKFSISAFSWRICISLMSLLPPQSTMTTVVVLTGLPHFPLNASTTSISENAVRDAIHYKEITLAHIAGVSNPADLFTKEHKDQVHFLALTNCVLSPPGSMGGCWLFDHTVGAGLSAGAPGGTHSGNVTVGWSTTHWAGRPHIGLVDHIFYWSGRRCSRRYQFG